MQNHIIQGSTKRVALKLFQAGTTTAATGKTVAIQISKNGGAFGNPSAGATNATEIANGWYYVDLSATDTGTIGPVIVSGSAAGCDNAEQAYEVVPGTVQSGVPYQTVNTGYTGLTSPLPVSASQGTAAAVAAGSITLAAPASDPRTAWDLTGWEVEVVTATTGAGQRTTILSYNASTQVATVAWPGVTPTGTVGYNLYNKLGTGFLPALVSASPTPTTTTFSATATWLPSTNGSFVNATTPQYVEFIAGNLVGVRSPITGYTYSAGVAAFTVAALPAAPSGTSAFVIL